MTQTWCIAGSMMAQQASPVRTKLLEEDNNGETLEGEGKKDRLSPQRRSASDSAVRKKLVREDHNGKTLEGAVEEDCFSPQRRSASDSAPTTPRIISNLHPTQILEGTSGVYLLTNDKGVGVAVFKPLDEENLPAEASDWAVSNGMGYFRERAAFVVSDEILEGYSGVPTTVIATVKHEGWAGGEKRGSLQRFVPASSDMCDLGPANIPAQEVQKGRNAQQSVPQKSVIL